MNRRVKLAAAAVGALVVAGAVVVVTAAATNVYRNNASNHPATQPATAASPGAQGAAGGKQAPANPAQKAVHQAVLQAEAQALGIKPKELSADLRQGTTVHQLADQKGLSQAAFQAAFGKDLTAALDQDVQKGALTSQQEQQALKRLGSTVPNWDQAAKPKTK